MTTVATDGRVMAADGQVTTNRDFIVHLADTKIKRTRDGAIVGCCGGSGCDEPFIEWLNGGDKPDGLDENFVAIVIKSGAPPRVYWHDLTSNVIAVPYAIGSGAPFALAAMDLGKKPGEAVAYAATRDVYTGGTVMEVALDRDLRSVA